MSHRKATPCVQSLPSNAAAVIVSETKGDATYQVRPDNAVLFQRGRISDALPAQENCGCPAPLQKGVAKAAPPLEPGPAQPGPVPQPAVGNEQVPVDVSSVVPADPALHPAPTVVTGRSGQNKPASSAALSPNVRTAAPTSSEIPPASASKDLRTLNAFRNTKQYFFVQVGAFKVKENAYRLADGLKNKSYPDVNVVERKDSARQLWYLVRVGRYEDRALARSLATKLASEDDLELKPFIAVM